MRSRKRVVVAGLGDSGILAAIRLARHADVIGVSTKPGLVSGQELGWRLSRPDEWARTNWIAFHRFRGLDRVRTVHASLTGVDLAQRLVFACRADGSAVTEHYDTLVISTGVSNGFWRQPGLQSEADIAAGLRAAHDRLAAADSVMVIGGGAAAVSSAAQVAATWPAKRVDLYFPAAQALLHHHPRTWDRVARRLGELGVALHPGHRAVIPEDFGCDRITSEPVRWGTGQRPAEADAVLWTVGRVRPNTGWLPAETLDEHGFVRVTPDLRVPGHPEVFALGDVAATDPLRSSARNRADVLLAHNIRAAFAGRPLRSYRPPKRRWGSVLGIQPDGLDVYLPNGRAFRFPAWAFNKLLLPFVVGWGYYHGLRHNNPLTQRPAAADRFRG
ncbi:pyridine nucleotide-disulfide oxidoreductase [Mycobacterium colombiense]|uniref:FAD-dependent oxidoreductase n=1 Tax=Mycobacterium colombiense TaxID=339268 RepID=UPI0007EFDFD0|nr:FAD-dependent oxidoreductase [Mycobacterium colombiense]OBK66273.1 pyridine nucleotide-disulfide oxidoreductase [Mycobacterium colombiense]